MDTQNGLLAIALVLCSVAIIRESNLGLARELYGELKVCLLRRCSLGDIGSVQWWRGWEYIPLCPWMPGVLGLDLYEGLRGIQLTVSILFARYFGEGVSLCGELRNRI
jgi:hypothetical protein